jgi:hypothetical protein
MPQARARFRIAEEASMRPTSPARLVLAAVAGAGLLLSAAAPVAAAAAGHVRVFGNCQKPAYEPHLIVPACGDFNLGVKHAKYEWWTRHTAHGSGRFVYNDCQPDCASGKAHHLHAAFTLFRVRHTKKYGDLFTRISIDTRQGHQVYSLPTSPV